MIYRHTQSSFRTAMLTVTFALALTIVLFPGLDESAVLLPAVAFLVVAAGIMFVFSRLTVTVDDATVIVAFGLGWPKHVERLDEIIAVRKVRNKWIYGWGIRKIPDGWMYNVWGLDAVEADLVSGKKFRMGTDDPEGLLAALTLAISPK